MKSIFLHIGPHKTGTTTIQEGLNVHRDLLMVYGFLVPKSGQVFCTNAGQHNLAWELREDERFDVRKGTWKDLVNEINTTDSVNAIISSESFSNLSLEMIKELRNYLAGFLVKVIVYVRRQDLLMQSFWTELIKTGVNEHEYKDFSTWIEEYDFENRNGNYQILLEKWSSVFSKENIIVRVLEKNQLNGTLFNDFLLTCGVESTEKFSTPPDMNKSPGLKVILLIQEFKRRLSGKLDINERNSFYSMISEYGSLAGWNESKWTLIDRKTYAKITDLHKDNNTTIAREYFARDQLFFEDYNGDEYTDFSIQDFNTNELLDLYAFIFTKNLEEHRRLVNQVEVMESSRGWRILEKLRSIKKGLKIY